MRIAPSWRRPAALAALVLALAGCGASTLPAIHSDTERLGVARRLHASGKHTQAIELLTTYISGAGGSADVDEAIYLLGDSYLKTKEWAQAQGEFERLLRDYPESDSSGAAAFGLGAALFGRTRPEDFDQEFTVKAIEQWQAYLRDHPGHWLNVEAERRVQNGRTRLANKLVDTGELYLKQQHIGPARVYFERVLADYPDTTASVNARVLLAVTDAKQGRREEAIAALREIETQYPGLEAAKRAARERKRIERR